MRVVTYVRPWSAGLHTTVARATFPHAEILPISDFRGLGVYPWADKFNARMRTQTERSKRIPWLSEQDEYEVLARNYYLRSVPLNLGRRLISAMAVTIDEALDQLKPDLLFLMAQDSYVLDLLSRALHARGVPSFGLIPCPFRGYARISYRGEYVSFRKPSEDEVQRALDLITQPQFRPIDLTDWLETMGEGNVLTLNRALRESPKRWYFPILRTLRRDPYNYHYRSSALARANVLTNGLRPGRHFDHQWRSRFERRQGLRVFMPLPYYPEATTDYNVAQLDLTHVPTLIPEILETLNDEKDIQIIVKEHPGMMGVRPVEFYQAVRRHSNVIHVSGYERTPEIIEHSDVMLIWTGTSGLETACRHQPVVTIGRPFYSAGRLFKEILRRAEIGSLASLLRTAGAIKGTEADARHVATRVLESSVGGEFRQIGFDTRATGAEEARVLGAAISACYDSWRHQVHDAYEAHIRGLPTAPGPADSI